MTTRQFGDLTLERVSEYVWELPKEGGMRAPARVFASEALLEQIGDDRTLQQLRNATHLPGIANYAVCMPDGHQGYGFPVGGVGATDAETGCLSPGSVGYDINCLAGSSEVLMEFGRRRPIRDLRRDFADRRAVVAASDTEACSDVRLFTERDEGRVYELTTAAGDTIEATADHPFATPDGMVDLDEIEEGDDVFVHPFVGLPDEDPPEFAVLEETDFSDEDPQLRRALEDRGLLPLYSTDEAFNHLLKLVAYHTVGGSFSGDQSWFYGSKTDLETIRSDIEAVGFTPSRVSERHRDPETDGHEVERPEYGVRCTSNAFRALLTRLGAPEGRTVESSVTAPDYLDRVADWQRALYLSAVFGAEMSAPDAVAPKEFAAPSVSHSRTVAEREAGEGFMRDLMRHLSSLGIETDPLETVERTRTTAGETVRLGFGVSSGARNLVRFFTTVGYRYATAKQRSALLAAQYLKCRERVVDRRARTADEARALADGGTALSGTGARCDGVNGRVGERSPGEGRDGRPRPPAEFPTFEEFSADHTVRDDMTVESEVVDIRELGEKTVYDIGVEHDAHNFVANGFVVSNCGVRMVKTNLEYDDLRGRESELVDALFDAVPSGLGGGGVVETSVDEVEAVLERGLDWAVERGYAVEADRAHCEDEGLRPEADAAAVSQKAKDRGRSQLGSLGSGNHFLEVQRVTDVFRGDVAEAYGLREGQVVVLVHCGSRGLGHQTCTDYLRRIEREHADLLDSLPDRELAAAPAGSDLADEYYRAMCACINFAWVNRQLITHRTREVFADVFGTPWEDLEMELLYDVAHNIAKKEVHEVPVDAAGHATAHGEGVGRAERELYVHRKGATRAFPAGRSEVPRAYRDVGQPVIIPGSMGAGSYVLRGGDRSLELSFGSTAHGAGRLMSRTQAKDEFWGGDVQAELREGQGVYVKAQSGATVAEEAPGVYKDVDEVVRVSDELGIGETVARTFPVCNIKG